MSREIIVGRKYKVKDIYNIRYVVIKSIKDNGEIYVTAFLNNGSKGDFIFYKQQAYILIPYINRVSFGDAV